MYDRRRGREGWDQRISINDPISRVIRSDCVVFALTARFSYRAEYRAAALENNRRIPSRPRFPGKKEKEGGKIESRIFQFPRRIISATLFNSHLFSGTGAARLIEFLLETRPCIFIRFIFVSWTLLLRLFRIRMQAEDIYLFNFWIQQQYLQIVGLFINGYNFYNKTSTFVLNR